MRAFKPKQGGTVSLAATNSSSRVALVGATDAPYQVRIYNAGPATAFLGRGDSSVTAATTNMPLPAGVVEVITLDGSVTHLAAITPSGAATLYFTTGEGV